jgi:hypothetical protein
MPNYLIKHLGMGFPVGSVVPASVFPGNLADHLAIGSIVSTTNPANVELPEFLATPVVAGEVVNRDNEADLYRLREELVRITGRRAEALNKIEEVEEQRDAAIKALDAMTKDRDEWKALAEAKETSEILQDPSKQKPLTP